MAIPYNGNIPQPTDLPSNSQPQILANFGSIKTLIDQDHVDFSGINPGQHNQVSLVNQAGLPVFNPLGMIGLYSATDGVTSKSELYINKTNASGIVQVPATESILGTTAAPSPNTYGNIGWTMLPSGIKLAWGTFTGAGFAQTQTLTANQAFATQILSIQFTIAGNSITAVNAIARLIGYPAANQFSVAVTDLAGNFSTAPVIYLAIGY